MPYFQDPCQLSFVVGFMIFRPDRADGTSPEDSGEHALSRGGKRAGPGELGEIERGSSSTTAAATATATATTTTTNNQQQHLPENHETWWSTCFVCVQEVLRPFKCDKIWLGPLLGHSGTGVYYLPKHITTKNRRVSPVFPIKWNNIRRKVKFQWRFA